MNVMDFNNFDINAKNLTTDLSKIQVRNSIYGLRLTKASTKFMILKDPVLAVVLIFGHKIGKI